MACLSECVCVFYIYMCVCIWGLEGGGGWGAEKKVNEQCVGEGVERGEARESVIAEERSGGGGGGR